MSVIHYGSEGDDYTRCGKTAAGKALAMEIPKITCKTCLAALGAITHPSTGERHIWGRKRKVF